MNILLWILQILLAIHTFIGAIWKYSNSEQTVAPLKAIPHEIWLSMSVIELLCSICLILPLFKKQLGILAPIAALFIAAEMLLFCVFNIFSGEVNSHHLIYWLIAAAICAFIAYGRLVIKPINYN